jgi:matrixin
MNLRPLLLPALSVAGAALLLLPARPTQAFTKLGGLLGETQRDVRLFDNFLDPTANDNLASPAQFPGWTGAELAMWKAIVEWGSGLHGTGSGDPLGGNLLGSGGANFDALWSGNANAIGTTNHNVVSGQTDCGGSGTLAYCETPISDGWRIRFCDEWTWDDGPGSVPGRWDIQSVMAHEYGHALGLGHSDVGAATMTPGVAEGSTGLRSIHADDIAGIQCIYGVVSGTKPLITATVADAGAGTITIHGSNFGDTSNEVWFTNENVTAPSADPIVRLFGVSSSGGGTLITVSIPADASPGDVMINKSGSGGATLSNAFPTDLVGTFGTPPVPHPAIASVTPSTIDALIPGTAETITITGTSLDLATALTLDGLDIPASRWTVVDAGTLTLDMPMAATLGVHNLAVSDGSGGDTFPVTVVANAGPTLEWGTGDALNPVVRGDGLDMRLAGPVGSLLLVRGSPGGPPSLTRYLRGIGMPLVDAGAYAIPSNGWLFAHVGGLPDPSLVGSVWHARAFSPPQPFAVSNDQSITLLP